MDNLGWLENEHWSMDEQQSVGSRLQNFVICIEMFIASLVFAYVFPPKVSALLQLDHHSWVCTNAQVAIN